MLPRSPDTPPLPGPFPVQRVQQQGFEIFLDNEPLEGTVVKGTVVAIEKDLAIIDVGLKTEGRIALKEFGQAGRDGSGA